MSQSMISGIELGQKAPKREFVVRIDDALNAEGALLRRWDNLRQSDGFPDWFRDVAELEKNATEIREFHPLLIPGLLQTKEYARTIIRTGKPTDSDAEVKEQVEARLRRQLVLSSEHPPWFLVVLDEPWLRRPTGGPEVMKAQLDHLAKASAWPRVTIQVIPTQTKHHPGHDGAFKLITVPDKGQVLYTETRAVGYPLDDPEVVEDYMKVFGELRGVALPEEASRDLIQRISGELQ